MKMACDGAPLQGFEFGFVIFLGRWPRLGWTAPMGLQIYEARAPHKPWPNHTCGGNPAESLTGLWHQPAAPEYAAGVALREHPHGGRTHGRTRAKGPIHPSLGQRPRNDQNA